VKRSSSFVSFVCSVGALASLSVASNASAGGMFFSDRGVRPMGRAGAFVAGADDLGAIWYNPAGLADAKTSLLLDFSWLRFSSEYTRQLRVVDADNTVRYLDAPKVTGSSPFIPFPTIAASYNFGRNKEWTIAGGSYAPYATIVTYPDQVSGRPTPARYALGVYDGSALILLGGWVSYKASEAWRFGAGVGALVGFFQSNITFNVSPPDRVVSAPEQPEYDAAASFRVGPIVAPTGNLGATWVPRKEIRVGASLQLPVVVSSSATFDVRLPNAAIFDGARINGRDANVRFVLPPVFRVGVEGRPMPDARVELTYVREFWSLHDTIDLTPTGVAIENVAGLPKRVPLPSISFPRHFQDSNSLRLGGEYSIHGKGFGVDLRAGASFESSAIPKAYLSILTIDMAKVTLAIGAGLRVGEHVRLDANFAHILPSAVNVSADEARIPRVNPLAGNAPLEAVNGGRYTAAANLAGVGVNYTF
jgi:long-chain fatty acid transport protein